MKNFTLERIRKVTKGRVLWPEEMPQAVREAVAQKEAAGVVVDSRLADKDKVFIALRGERADGHDFIAAALEQGALFVLCERPPQALTGPCLLVDSCMDAMRECAAFYREQLDLKVVGITGSVGKTTTKEFIASVLEQKYRVGKTEKNFNNEIGLPLTIFQLTSEQEAAVLEMGINHFGEMRRLSYMAKPDVCVMTNIGQCHLEYLGSRDGILKAKSEIFDFMKADGFVCVNGDDDKLSELGEIHGKRPYTFGLGKERDVFAASVTSEGLRGSRVAVGGSAGEFEARIPLPGEHMAYNALAAALVGWLFGLDAQEIKKGIEAVSSLKGRSHIVTAGSRTIIDDCYNANPDSVRAALELLSLGTSRRVAVLGDMFELGGKEEQMHRSTGAWAVGKADCLICIGKLSKFMYEGAIEANGDGSMEVRYFETKEAFFHEMEELFREDDTILIKASHGMAFEEITKRLRQAEEPASRVE